MRSKLRLLTLATVASACLLAGPGAAGVSAKTVWLCKPGKPSNPCAVGFHTTNFSPTGKRLSISNIPGKKRPRYDCFYVYPTVSDQKTAAANLDIDPELRSIALYQAARYGSDCRVYAPVYRQITLAGITGQATATEADRQRAYNDVRAAWRTYLRKYNKGRGVMVVGHSQGTFVLRNLVANEIDPKPKVRRRLISAVLLGGNVLVKKGSDRGGDFKHIRACRSPDQVGCVVAFSTFGAQPPAAAIFGRSNEAGQEVLCTNPAALGGGSAKLTPVQPTEPFAPGTTIAAVIALVGVPDPAASTPWRAFPDSYRGRCSSAGGSNVLRIDPLGGAPTLTPSPDAGWGLHLVDANIALGNLVGLVRHQAERWLITHR